METTVTKSSKRIYDLKIAAITVLLLVFAFYAIQNFQRKTASPLPAAGDTVINSSMDGSVWQVKSWLNRRAKDPDSIQYIEWSPVKSGNGVYTVRCKYRAKNSLGAYSVEEKVFHLNSNGDVVDVVELP